jgi:hemolysin activation/secretion protein
VGLSRPMYRTPEQTFTLGVSFERRQQQTFLLGMPFPFTAGAEPNGKTVVTPVRLYQDWLDRDAEHALRRAIHAQLRDSELGRHR